MNSYIVIAAMLCGASGALAAQELLWDNGDTDGLDGVSNGTAEIFGGRRSLLDDFVVPEGERWSICGFRSLHLWDTLPPGSGTGFELRIRHNSDRGSTPFFAYRHGRSPADVIATATVTSYEESATGRVWFSREEAESYVIFDEIVLDAGTYWLDANVIGPENNFWLLKDRTLETYWFFYEKFGGPQSPFEPHQDLSWTMTGTVLSPRPEDVDGDGRVDVSDLASVLSAWGGDGGHDGRSDVDGDGAVDHADVIAVLEAWVSGER